MFHMGRQCPPSSTPSWIYLIRRNWLPLDGKWHGEMIRSVLFCAYRKDEQKLEFVRMECCLSELNQHLSWLITPPPCELWIANVCKTNRKMWENYKKFWLSSKRFALSLQAVIKSISAYIEKYHFCVIYQKMKDCCERFRPTNCSVWQHTKAERKTFISPFKSVQEVSFARRVDERETSPGLLLVFVGFAHSFLSSWKNLFGRCTHLKRRKQARLVFSGLRELSARSVGFLNQAQGGI